MALRIGATTTALLVLGSVVACSGKESNGSAAGERNGAASATQGGSTAATSAAATQCASDNGGITLPHGFCASVFADSVGGARHVAVAPNGDVYVMLATAPKSAEAGSSKTGGVLAMRDTNHDGKADVTQSFGTLGGTGVALRGDALYVDARTAILRYTLPAGALVPTAAPDTVVKELPTGGHAARNMALDSAGALYVNVGSPTNSCQVKDRQKESPGKNPCDELKTRAGIWKCSASGHDQTETNGCARLATGIRNAVGLAIDPANGKLYATQHGRDQLFQNWPKYYTAQDGAEKPAEELFQPQQGDDYGWPYCYFDPAQRRLMLAPEYGGNGKTVGQCAQKKGPLVYFPGHWAPDGLTFYAASAFPAHYRNGAFIAFHGSWNRAPEPQAGYKVVFVPMSSGGVPSPNYETFADGFAGSTGPLKQPNEARHRPVGVAVGPDGALYVTDDAGGRIWKIVYRQ